MRIRFNINDLPQKYQELFVADGCKNIPGDL